MLSNNNQSKRSFRSLKSLVNFYGSSADEETLLNLSGTASCPKQPRIIHLPPSIQNSESLSPTLWLWIKSKDFTSEDDVFPSPHELASEIPKTSILEYGELPKLIAYSGKILRFPPHLLNIKNISGKSETSHTTLARSKTLGRNDRSSSSSRASLVSGGSIRVKALPRKPIYSMDLSGAPSTTVSPTAEPVSLSIMSRRRDIFKEPTISPKVARFYLQLLTINLKTSCNVSTIYCKVQTGASQRFFTVPEHCVKESSKGFGLVVHMKEAFILDIPNDHEEFTVLIHLHSAQNNESNSSPTFQGDLPLSESMDSIGHSESSSISSSAKAPSLFGIRKSISSSLFSHLPNNSTVKNNVVSGTLLIGELSFTLPSKKNFPKVTGTHSFTLNGKKEIAKCTMQMGLIFDEDGYTSIPKVVEAPFMGYLNFYMSTKSTQIWKKYWCVIQNGALEVYDFEYKEEKDIVGLIPLSHIQSAHKTEPSAILSTKNTVKLTMSSEFYPQQDLNRQNVQGEHISKSRSELSEDEWDDVWKRSLIDFYSGDELNIYVMAEGKVKADDWLKRFYY